MANATVVRFPATLVGATASTGLTLSSAGLLTANLSTGVSGGQVAYGGTGDGETLELKGSTHANNGKVLVTCGAGDPFIVHIGTNDRLSVGDGTGGSANPGGIGVTGSVFCSTFWAGDLNGAAGTDETMQLRPANGTAVISLKNGALAFFNGTPRAQGAAVADPSGGATIDAECRTAVIALLNRLRAAAGCNLIAT